MNFVLGGDWYKVLPLDGGLASRVFVTCFGDSEADMLNKYILFN